VKQYTCPEVFTAAPPEARVWANIIVAAGAGTGISAKFERQGVPICCLVSTPGATGCMPGSLPASLAYGYANAIALDNGTRQILPIVK
jgi:predicted TIM-barrel enzyme